DQTDDAASFPLPNEDVLLHRIQAHAGNFPILKKSILALNLLYKMVDIVKQWREILKHRQYKTIRDVMIRVWGGGEVVRISSRIFDISDRQVQKIISGSETKAIVSVNVPGSRTRLRG